MVEEFHADVKAYHERMVSTLQGQETKFVNRLRQLYVDKLDGSINDEVYEQLKADWEKELADCRRQLAAHQQADRRYLEYGIQLLELGQNAYSSYSRRSPLEKRRLLNFVLSNCSLMDGELTPTYRQPFDLLASAAAMTQNGSCPDPSDPSSQSEQYPLRDCIRTCLAKLTDLETVPDL